MSDLSSVAHTPSAQPATKFIRVTLRRLILIIDTWTETQKSQYTNVYTHSRTHIIIIIDPFGKIQHPEMKECVPNTTRMEPMQASDALLHRRAKGDSSQGSKAALTASKWVETTETSQHSWRLTIQGMCVCGGGKQNKSRCPQCWGRVLSPAVENRGSDTESSFPSSCSRWETAPPGRLRHKWCTASSPTGSWAGRSPWTWSGWTTGPDLRVWGSRGPGGATGGSTWSLRKRDALYELRYIRCDATTTQIPCVSVRD